MRLVFGLTGPRRKTPGLDVAGQVEAVGGDVKQLHPGDEVFGWCKGAFAEYACTAENNLLPKLCGARPARTPGSVTFERRRPTASIRIASGMTSFSQERSSVRTSRTCRTRSSRRGTLRSSHGSNQTVDHRPELAAAATDAPRSGAATQVVRSHGLWTRDSAQPETSEHHNPEDACRLAVSQVPATHAPASNTSA